MIKERIKKLITFFTAVTLIAYVAPCTCFADTSTQEPQSQKQAEHPCHSDTTQSDSSDSSEKSNDCCCDTDCEIGTSCSSLSATKISVSNISAQITSPVLLTTQFSLIVQRASRLSIRGSPPTAPTFITTSSSLSRYLSRWLI